MAKDFRSRWEQAKKIADGIMAQIDRLDHEKAELMDQIQAIEQKKAELETQFTEEAGLFSQACGIDKPTPEVRPTKESEPEADAVEEAFRLMDERTNAAKRNRSSSTVDEDLSTHDMPATSPPPSADATDVPLPERVLKKAKTSGKHAERIIAETHPTVIPSPHKIGSYLELRCGVCGGNYASWQKHYYRGAHGFFNHFMMCHRTAFPGGKMPPLHDIIERCTHHILTDKEIKGIKQGNADAYVVEKVLGSGREDIERATPADRASAMGTPSVRSSSMKQEHTGSSTERSNDLRG